MKKQIWGLGVSAVDPEIMTMEEYTVAGYKRCLDRIKKIGFKYVEYTHVHHLQENEVKAIADYAKSLDLVSYSVHSEGHILKYGRDKYFEIQKICVRNAVAMGCKIVVFHLPFPEGSPTKDENISPAGKLAEIAANAGITGALENGPVELICAIVAELNHPNLKIILDTGHALRDGYDICDCIKQMGPNLVHTHLADNFGITDDHLPPGIGLINWPGVITVLKAISYPGVLMVELTGPGMKNKRHIPGLRKLDLDIEMEVAFNVLNSLNQETDK